MTATTGKAEPPAALVKKRRKVAEDLLAIHRKLAKPFAEMDRLEAQLKALASEGGDSFKEDFGIKGHVSVSPPAPKKFNGNVPLVVPEAWLALKEAEQEKLQEQGLVRVEPHWTKAFGGRVTVKVL